MKHLKYLVIGAGGTGGSIGAYMTEAGKDVTLIGTRGAPKQMHGTWSVHGDDSQGKLHGAADQGSGHGTL